MTCITYMYFGGGRKSIADWPVCFVLKQKISYIDLDIPISVTLTEIHVPALIFYKVLIIFNQDILTSKNVYVHKKKN